MKRTIYQLAILIVFVFGIQACENIQHDHSHYHPHPVLYATLYQQQAAEYRALCFQAFNLAALQLDMELAANHTDPLAVVVDIDETILDNSPYQAQAIKEGFGYPKNGRNGLSWPWLSRCREPLIFSTMLPQKC